MAAEIVEYEKKFRASESKRVMLECDVAARGYEIEAMYDSLLIQERIHVEAINLLQQIVDHIPMPIFWKDLDGKYLGCNKSYETETGFTKEAVIGKKSDMLYQEDWIDGIDIPDEFQGLSIGEMFNRSDEITKREGVHTYKLGFRLRTGGYIPAIFYKRLCYDIEGNPSGIIVFAHTKCDGSLCP